MLPPKYAKTVTVNLSENVASANITAVYKGKQVADEEVTVILYSGQSHTFPEKTECMGSWTAAKPIHIIKGKIEEDDSKTFEQNTEEHCKGIEPNLAFMLHHEPNHIKLMK